MTNRVEFHRNFHTRFSCQHGNWDQQTKSLSHGRSEGRLVDGLRTYYDKKKSELYSKCVHENHTLITGGRSDPHAPKMADLIEVGDSNAQWKLKSIKSERFHKFNAK